jgi:AGCS family alanine or glycine:cation symporter
VLYLQTIIDFLNNFIWTYVVIGGLLGAGLYFTFKIRFMQFRYIGEMFRVVTEKSKDVKGMKSISPFKSFSIGAATL